MANALASRLTVRGRRILDVDRRRSAEAYELRDDDGKTKERQRRQVLDFLLSHHSDGEVRLLSLPDEKWTFERLLESSREHCKFLGLQWSWMHLERGLPWMPGSRLPSPFAVGVHIGNVTGFETDKARIVFCHASGLLGLTGLDVCGPGHNAERNRRHKEFASYFRSSTAVWLDFTSQICTEVERSLSRLWIYADPRRPIVPVAVSVLAARDGESSDDDRVATLCRYMNRKTQYRAFTVECVWRHQSADTPFLTVAGLIRNVEREATA